MLFTIIFPIVINFIIFNINVDYTILIMYLFLQHISWKEEKGEGEGVEKAANWAFSCWKDSFNEFYSVHGEMLLTSLAQ